jgi:hypothetical protein
MRNQDTKNRTEQNSSIECSGSTGTIVNRSAPRRGWRPRTRQLDPPFSPTSVCLVNAAPTSHVP